MEFYISSHHPVLANEVAQKIREAGHKVRLTWHDKPDDRPAKDDAVAWSQKAQANFCEIIHSDVVVLTGGEDKYTGGKFVEAGFGLGQGCRVCVVGRVENGMLYHPAIRRYDTVEEMLKDYPVKETQ